MKYRILLLVAISFLASCSTDKPNPSNGQSNEQSNEQPAELSIETTEPTIETVADLKKIIKDPNFKACFNQYKDDILIATIPVLDCVDMGIEDASEMVYLQSLKEVYLTDNKLESIAVPGSVVHLTADNNQIKTINPENNPRLITLSLENNQLTNINMSNNFGLATLNLKGNRLADIDLDANGDLTILDVSYNRLSTIDLTNQKKLHEVMAAHNYLIELDLTQNEKLEKVIGTHNYIDKISISDEAKIVELDLRYNNIRFLPAFLDADFLQSSHINLIKNPLSQQAEDKLNEFKPNYTSLKFEPIAYFTGLTDVTIRDILDDENIDPEFVACLSNVPSDYLVNEILVLTCSKFDIESVELSPFASLTSLSISDSSLETIDLTENFNLSEVHLVENQLHSISLSDLSEESFGIESLKLGGNELEKLDVSSLNKLMDLSVNDNKLEELNLPPGIINLDVSDNPLTSLEITECSKIDWLAMMDVGTPFALSTRSGGSGDSLKTIYTNVLSDDTLHGLAPNAVVYRTR